MTTRTTDYAAMARVHALLHQAADEVDDAAISMPASVHAGPLANKVAELMLSISEESVEAVIRLRLAATTVQLALENYAYIEHEAERESRNVGRQMGVN